MSIENSGWDCALMTRQKYYWSDVQSWGHNSMHCGYGHVKREGRCQPLDWYQTDMGCYETTIIQRESGYHQHEARVLNAETTSIIEGCHPSTVVSHGKLDLKLEEPPR